MIRDENWRSILNLFTQLGNTKKKLLGAKLMNFLGLCQEAAVTLLGVALSLIIIVLI
ncbi:MAG: hypothetical protein AB4060_06060 [Crocosphaera sp.]